MGYNAIWGIICGIIWGIICVHTRSETKECTASERCGNDAVGHNANEISMSEVRVREICGRDERDTLSGLTPRYTSSA